MQLSSWNFQLHMIFFGSNSSAPWDLKVSHRASEIELRWAFAFKIIEQSPKKMSFTARTSLLCFRFFQFICEAIPIWIVTIFMTNINEEWEIYWFLCHWSASARVDKKRLKQSINLNNQSVIYLYLQSWAGCNMLPWIHGHMSIKFN